MKWIELSEDCKKIVHRFGLHVSEYQPEIPAAYFGRGSTNPLWDSEDFDYWVHCQGWNWRYVESWGNGYRSVWVSDTQWAILTYVEGDVDLTVDADTETFDARLRAANEFYQKY